MQQMQEIKEVRNGTSYKNGGFTLVEVIIAVIIMAIAAIPLLHAFSTSANTSSKALVKMRATNAAENIMEDIKGMSVEEVVAKYGQASDPQVIAPNYDGKNIGGIGGSTPYITRKDELGNPIQAGYKFELKSGSSELNTEVSKLLDTGNYIATIELDPTMYPNINSVNMSDFDEVSSMHSAIISVDESLDKQALKKFKQLNSSMDAAYIKKDSELLPHLKREIRIEVTKKGPDVDIDGEAITPVEVTATVSYLAYNNAVTKCVPDNMESQRMLYRKVFSNVSNNKKLNSVFVLYQPYYDNAADDGDIIVVYNRDSVDFNLYVVAQDAVGDKWDKYRDKTKDAGLILEIYEKEKDAITLYTNLHDTTEYLRKEDSALLPVQCYLNVDDPFMAPEAANDKFDDHKYGIVKNRKGSWENTSVTKEDCLDARDIDGKYLDASKVEDKIYDVRVTVRKKLSDEEEAKSEEERTEWPISVTLTGTLVDK